MNSLILKILSVVIIFHLWGCENNKKTMIARKWKIAELEVPKMQEIIKNTKDADQTKQYRALLRDMVENSTFNFKTNGDYKIIISLLGGVEKVVEGQWNIENDVLITTEKNSKKVHRMKIDPKSNTFRISLIEGDGDKKTTLVLVPV